MKHLFKKLLTAALALILAVQPLTAAAVGMDNHAPDAPTGLLTNESEHPMNVEGAPLFGWWVNDEDYDEVQTAYEIRLYDGVTEALVWDSGKVESDQQASVPYIGEALKPGYPYSWEVSTWDSRDQQSPYSDRAEFATGLEDEDWNAQWIQGVAKNAASPLSIVTEEVFDGVSVSGGGMTLRGDSFDWTDYELSVNLTPVDGAAGVAFRVSEDYQTGYVWQLLPGTGLVKNKVSGGQLTQLGTVSCEIKADTAYTLTVKAEGGVITTVLNGDVIDSHTDDAPIAAGAYGVYAANGEKALLHSLSAAQTKPAKWLKVTGNNSTPFALYTGGYDWDNYTVEFDVIIHNVAAALMLRSSDTNSGYMWQFSLKKSGLARHIRTASGFTKIDGDGSVACALTQGKQHHASFTVNGNVITTYLDGKLIDTYTDKASTYTKGTFGFREAGNETASFRNIKVTAADGTVLYRETAESADSYESAGHIVSVTEDAAASYTADFSDADLAAWVSQAESFPLTRVSKTVFWAEASNDGVVLLGQGADWTDYTLSLDMKVMKTSAGIAFRAPDGNNTGYMWSIRSDGNLRLHKGESGSYVRIGTNAESDLPLGIKNGQTYHLTIEVMGDTITTWLDGKQVDTRTSAVSAQGTIGLRTDSNETGRYTNILVKDKDGNVLFAEDFSAGTDRWDAGAKRLTADNSYWYSRKAVALEAGKEVKKAVAYVSGSQDYELRVNGTRIGRAQTYDFLGETKYQGWDITEAVKGQEAAAFGVLTSYFGSAQGRAKSMAGLLGKFIIYYTDGTSQTVVTDDSWLTHATGYSNSGRRNGEGDEIEYCDARLMRTDWAEVDCDTTDWEPAAVHGDHPTATFYHLQPEVGHVAETVVKPVSVTTLENGTTVADFGKVIPAMVRIHFPDGTAGTQITVQEGYELNSDGTINTAGTSTQGTKMTYVYTMADGEQTFEAWGYLGFRYVSVPAAAGKLTAEDFSAVILHAEIVEGRESTLDTSDEMMDQVFEFMKRSGLYSVQNQFVDTPTREKGQFLGDAINISAATMSGSYERQMTRKAILQFIDSAKRFWNSGDYLGRYNAVYPNIEGRRDIPEYTLNFPLLVWRYYLLTGDRTLLEYAYPYMRDTADYVGRYTNAETGLVTAIGTSTSFGDYYQGIIDWPKPGRFDYDWNGTKNGVRTTINALSVRTYDTVIAMAEELGYTEDAAAYTEKADALRAAMNGQLITDTGVYTDGLTSDGAQSAVMSQHATSHAIMAGVPTEEALDVMGDYIASMGMKQGPMTADILVEALFESGRADAAVKLLTNTEDYGWAKLIHDGYTFTFEQWQYGQSQSHGWGAASLWQIIEHISGVQVTEAAAKTVRIDPAEGAVERVSGHTVTAAGAVDVVYSGSGADYTIDVVIPANVTAEVVFPLVEGGEFVEINGRNGENTFTETAQIMTVGSGERSFRFVPIEAARAVDALIDAINVEDRATIDAARAAYDALTDEQKALVTGLAALEAAELYWNTVHNAVALVLSGAEAVDTFEEETVYTLSAKGMNNLAAMIVSFAVPDEYLTDPVAVAAEGWMILAQAEKDGVFSVSLVNLEGADGEGEILKLHLKPTGTVGQATVSITYTELCAYLADGETFVQADLDAASVTTELKNNRFDVNKDGIVDQRDLTRAQRYFDTDYPDADVNTDGEVNIDDLILILNHFHDEFI